jgi:hypothetical protein
MAISPEVPLLLASTGMAVCLMSALIVFQSLADNRIFALLVKESAVSPEGFRSKVNQKISYGCERENQDLI